MRAPLPRTGAVLLILGAALAASGCSSRSGNVFRVATGYASHVLCSDIFVSGQDPGRDYTENIAASPALRPLQWAMSHEVDRARREVRVRVFGGFETRAIYRDSLGCLNVNGEGPVDAPPPASLDGEPPAADLLGDIAGPGIVEPQHPGLKTALDTAFAEPGGSTHLFTHAVVIVHEGRVIAERYAPGWSVDTPVHAWSASKLVTNALIGILVRQGKLAVNQPAPIAAWQAPGDPRHAITVDHLLRMQSGLALGNSLTAGISSGWDSAARTLFNEPDQAGFAQQAELEAAPGTVWIYTDSNSHLLARLVRDAAGGHAGDVLRFARRELFAPLGMRRVTMELDATGTPIGAVFMFAPARDWARIGLLFLNDGVVGGKRLLPDGWVRYSAEPAPNAPFGYGAHWWTNLGDSQGARTRVGWGMPPDSFFASGSLGQYVIVVPSKRLVVTRFGVTHDPVLAMRQIARLVADTVAALHGKTAP
jgi:CubicO group peptidase (beta-lactamase class C family)